MEYTNGECRITNDKKALDLAAIHDMLSKHANWCRGISMEVVQKSIANSLNFGLFHKERQVGFARVITDYATIAYLGDVFIYP